jgi:hypothetical protein
VGPQVLRCCALGAFAHRICGQGFVVRHTAHDPRELELGVKDQFLIVLGNGC